MFQDPTFWVAVAFIILLGVAFYFKVHRALIAKLDERAARIKAQLDEAQTLREEAQKTLAEYQRKQRDAIAETQQIIDHAKEEAGRMRDEAQAELERALARRADQAEEKIAQAEAAALKEVRNQAVDIAMAAAAKLLAEEVKPAKAKALIDESIEELSKKLN
jgi:F-type H+-transporting ATPase subunit b